MTQPITVLGAGDVVRRRYASVIADPTNPTGIWMRDVFSTKRTELDSLAASTSTSLRPHKCPELSAANVSTVLSDAGLASQPVVIATPTYTHAPLAKQLLSDGFHVAIEKPFARSLEEAEVLIPNIVLEDDSRLFLLGYYALEKGLTGIAIHRAEHIQEEYLNALHPPTNPEDLASVRRSLGDLKRLSGVILEGRGLSATVTHRPWVVDSANGGNTLETFYHLVCMAVLFLAPEHIAVSYARCGTHLGIARDLRNIDCNPGETLTQAHLITNSGIEANLLCAKAVDPAMHSRWMCLEYELGTLVIDFETSQCQVMLGDRIAVRLCLKDSTPYLTQFKLLGSWLRTGTPAAEYEWFRKSLSLTLSVRAAAMTIPAFQYESADIDIRFVGAAMRSS